MRARLALRMGALMLLAGTGAGQCGTEPSSGSTYALDLTMSGAGQGTLTIQPQAQDTVGTSFYFAKGATVSVGATAATGSSFTGWGKASGTLAAPAGCTQPVNPCTVTLDDHKSVVGHFTPSTGIRRFDGEYTGTMAKDGNAGITALELRIDNGVVQGWLTPSGTLGTFTGTLKDDGSFTVTVQGVGGACPVTFLGQFAVSASAGITAVSGSGRFDFPQGQTCNGTPGTWAVSRDQVPVTKTVAPRT